MPSHGRLVFSIEREGEIVYSGEITDLNDPLRVHKAYEELNRLRREDTINIYEFFTIIREINRLTGLSPRGARDLASSL